MPQKKYTLTQAEYDALEKEHEYLIHVETPQGTADLKTPITMRLATIRLVLLLASAKSKTFCTTV